MTLRKQGLFVIPGDIIDICGSPVFVLKVKRPDEEKPGFEIYQKGTLAIKYIDLTDPYWGAMSAIISPQKMFCWEKLEEERYKKVLSKLIKRRDDAQEVLLLFKTVKVLRDGNAVA